MVYEAEYRCYLPGKNSLSDCEISGDPLVPVVDFRFREKGAHFWKCRDAVAVDSFAFRAWPKYYQGYIGRSSIDNASAYDRMTRFREVLNGEYTSIDDYIIGMILVKIAETCNITAEEAEALEISLGIVDQQPKKFGLFTRKVWKKAVVEYDPRHNGGANG